MSFFYSVSPAFQDKDGVPFSGGLLYYGEPNVDPIQNPKNIFLDAALTVPAANPQILDVRGVASQGVIYMEDGGSLYSILLEDALGNQIFNIPSAVGVGVSADLENLPAVTIVDSITVKSTTTAQVVINSGVATGAEGKLEFQESEVPQWKLLRKAIVDGGAIILRRLSGAGSPDEPIEFPFAGGFLFRMLGVTRIKSSITGTGIFGPIENAKQVLVAGGTFLHDGTPQGETLGISGFAAVGPAGEYVVTLDFFPVDEADLEVQTSAELAGVEMVTRGDGGGFGTGTVLVFSSVNGGARTNATSVTVQVFDLGRV